MEKKSTSFSFRAYAWSQFKKNKPAWFSWHLFILLAVIALFAPLLANDLPLYANYKGHHLFPAFSYEKNYLIEGEKIQLDIADWKQMKLDNAIWAPIPYSPNKSDLLNIYAAPGGEQFFKGPNGIEEMPQRFRHLLGTSKRGEDLLAGLVHGTRISLTIGILSMGIATLLGLFLGALAGYFGDEKLKTKRGVFWMTLVGIVLGGFYGFSVRSYELADGLANPETGAFLVQFGISILYFVAALVICRLLGKVLSYLPLLNQDVFIPVDSIVSRFIEILISTPRLILIISIAAIAKPSIVNLMVIIGLTSWTEIARFTRAEFLKIRNLEYIQAGQALGFSEMRVIFRHALPNGIAPALVAIAFGIASAILVESGLSFLGIGVPADVVTWGLLVNAGRENFQAWWLVVYPGFAIFLTVTIYNLLGEGLRDALDPRLKT